MGRTTLIAFAGLAASATFANAQTILTFGFTDVDGSFRVSDGVFEGRSVAGTSGDVSRLAAPGGTAQFNPGFAGGTADFSFDIDVMLTATPGIADGTGSFTIIDAQGESLVGDINGTFNQLGSFIVFQGLLSGVQFNDVSGDGTFDGPSGGSFGTDLPGTPPFEGAFVELFISRGGFFDRDFSGVSTQVIGEIVPAPASLALLGLGGLAAARRRR